MLFIVSRAINYFLHWVSLPFLIVLCRFARLFPKKYDIGMGPLPMINNVYWARALRLMGYRVQTFANEAYFITDEFDLLFDKGFKRLLFDFPILSFIRCIFSYRCMYVYYNGGPLQMIPGLRLLEPFLFRLAGVKTVVMPYGSDCQIFERTPNKLMVDALCKDYPVFFQKNHSRIVRQVDTWCARADIVVGAMDSIDYLPFWNRARLCHFAIDTNAYQPVYPRLSTGQPIKILHAPNHKAIKGSDAIFKAIEVLKSEGYPIELVFKQNIPNKEFLKLVSSVDIVIDQLVIGCYAMFAMEAMCFGKPTICYLRDDLIKTFEAGGYIDSSEIPLISAQTHDITDVLRNLLDAPERLHEIGKKSRDYVVKHHSLEVVGGFFDEINRSMGISPRGTV